MRFWNWVSPMNWRCLGRNFTTKIVFEFCCDFTDIFANELFPWILWRKGGTFRPGMVSRNIERISIRIKDADPSVSEFCKNNSPMTHTVLHRNLIKISHASRSCHSRYWCNHSKDGIFVNLRSKIWWYKKDCSMRFFKFVFSWISST